MFKVMVKVVKGYWFSKVFESESEARTYANHAFMTGAMQVELYRKTRDSYIPVKKVRQSAKQAAERCGRYLAEGF